MRRTHLIKDIPAGYCQVPYHAIVWHEVDSLQLEFEDCLLRVHALDAHNGTAASDGVHCVRAAISTPGTTTFRRCHLETATGTSGQEDAHFMDLYGAGDVYYVYACTFDRAMEQSGGASVTVFGVEEPPP